MQDAAYGTLLREPRRALHARIAETFLKREFAEYRREPTRDCWRAIVTEAGLIEKAVESWGKAGQRSLQRSTPIEASAHLRRGMTLLEQLPSSEPRRAQLHYRLMMAGWWL